MHNRAFNLLLAFFCHELLVVAYYFQYVQHLNPCPLCIVQRVALAAVGVWLLFLGLTNAKAGGFINRCFNGFAALSALLGIIAAGRQVYLQHLPPENVPSCGPGLDYMMEVFSTSDILKELLLGSGDCAKIDWTMFGFSMPEYMLALFSGFFLLTFWRAWRG